VRVALAALVTLAVAGCSDPTIDVRVEIPDRYRADVDTIEVTDYELDKVECDAIAYGDVPAEQLTGARRTEVQVTPGGGAPLAGVSRLDHKLLVARGRNAAGDLVVAGCTAVDVVEGAQTVTIATEPAALVTIDPRDPTTSFKDAAISIRVLDPDGAALPDRWLVARVFGPQGLPGGSTGNPACPRHGVDDCAQTDASGDLTLMPSVPTQPGPVLVQIHAEWARAQPPLVAGFTSPQVALFLLRAAVTPPPPACAAYRATSGVRLACLATAIGGAIEVQHFGWSGAAMAKLPGAQPAAGAVALLAVPSGASDRVVAITASGDWIDGVTGQTFAKTGAQVANAMVVPACGKQAFVAVGLVDGSIHSYDATGAAIATFADADPGGARFDLGGAGCISDVGAPTTTYRAIAITRSTADNAPAQTSARVDCPGAPCLPSWTGFGGLGFVIGAAGESRLAVGQLDLSGVIVTEWMIDRSAADPSKQLVSPIAHDAVSVPEQIVGGDFDGDGKSDRAWLLIGANAVGTVGRLQLSLGASIDGVPIAGLSPRLGSKLSGVVVARFDDDAIDDFAVFSPTVVEVVLSGRPGGK